MRTLITEKTLSARKVKLFYVHDPMCSWCWAFAPAWRKLVEGLPGTVAIVCVLGGLAPDTDRPMPEELRRKIQKIWQTIEIEVPGIHFNFDFWRNCNPRRATYAACRAVIAAVRQAPELETEMIRAIQNAYYSDARNPSENSVLIDLAGSLGLDRTRFTQDLESADTAAELSRQIAFARKMGVRGFPSLVLENHGHGYKLLEIDYHHTDFMLEQIIHGVEN